MFKDFELVRQENVFDCGICSLKMILKAYGGDYPLEKLRELTYTNDKGTNAYLIKEAAEKLGFKSKVVKAGIEDIESKFLPVIAHVIPNKAYEHFVVIYKINKNKSLITIADPALGRRVLTYGEFMEISTSYFILFDIDKKPANIKSSTYINSLILNFFINHKKYLIIVIIFSLLFTLLSILSSYSIKFLIDNVISYNSINNLILFLTIFLYINIIKNVFSYFKIKIANYFIFLLDELLIKSVFRHLLFLPYLYYKNRTSTDIVNRVNDLNNLKLNISKIFITVVLDGLLSLIVLIFLFRINYYLSFLIILMFLIYILITIIKSPIYNYYLEKDKEEKTKVSNFLYSSVKNLESIKNRNSEDYIDNNFHSIYHSYLNNSDKLIHTINKTEFLKNTTYNIFMILIYAFGAYLIIKDKIEFSVFLIFLSLLDFFVISFKNLIDLNFDFKELKIALKRLNELYDLEEDNFEKDFRYEKELIKGDIEFIDLSFSYNSYDYVLKNLNLKIKEGEKVLISGNTGSGKSTLFKLLMAYFPKTKGKIKINNREIEDYNLINIRESISYVSQNEIIFKDSLYNNISFGKDLSFSEFEKLIDLCSIDKIIEKNKFKSDMNLEEDGFNLSGGERSRVFLARALAKKANIYIFDETLANIDIRLEKIILEKIFKEYKDKTFIVISHRLSNKKIYDKVYDLGDLNA